MNKFVRACALFLAMMIGGNMLADETTEWTNIYDLKMVLKVPRIYDNTQSKGYRKYQTQTLKGYLAITFFEDGSRPEINIVKLVNKTHKMNGSYITYKVGVGGDYGGPYTRVNLIGNNKTGVFKTPSVVWYMDAEPSYNIGEDDEDNSLLLTCSGYGSVKTWSKYVAGSQVISCLNGFAAGTLGCGCRAYGHVSPTRVAGPLGPECDKVDDVASVCGKWTAKYNASLSPKAKRIKCGKSYQVVIEHPLCTIVR